MIASNSVLGIIFANMHDSTVSDLTKQRTMGSVLFGRYRTIDFPLSNMVIRVFMRLCYHKSKLSITP